MNKLAENPEHPEALASLQQFRRDCRVRAEPEPLGERKTKDLHGRIRTALEIPEGVPSSLFYEQYDTSPVIDLDDERVMNPLREQMHAALGR